MLNRSEHVQWCKDRALEYCDRDDLQGAYGSMASDLRNHDETVNHPGIELGMMLLMTSKLSTQQEMRKYINGFN